MECWVKTQTELLQTGLRLIRKSFTGQSNVTWCSNTNIPPFLLVKEEVTVLLDPFYDILGWRAHTSLLTCGRFQTGDVWYSCLLHNFLFAALYCLRSCNQIHTNLLFITKQKEKTVELMKQNKSTSKSSHFGLFDAENLSFILRSWKLDRETWWIFIHLKTSFCAIFFFPQKHRCICVSNLLKATLSLWARSKKPGYQTEQCFVGLSHPLHVLGI